AATGTVSYTYKFTLPPARGVAPELGLVYSSAGSVRGDIAQGWSLSPLPAIRRDVTREPTAGERAYTAYFGGSVQELVRVSGDETAGGGTAYRAKLDRDFTRFEMLPPVGDLQRVLWTARTTDGRTFTFWPIGNEDWRVTTVRDRWGNQILYDY